MKEQGDGQARLQPIRSLLEAEEDERRDDPFVIILFCFLGDVFFVMGLS